MSAFPKEGLAEFRNSAGEHLFDVVLNDVAVKENWDPGTGAYALADGVEALQRHAIDLLVGLPHTAAQHRQLRLSKEALMTTWAQVCLANGVEASRYWTCKACTWASYETTTLHGKVQRLTAGLDIACRFIEFQQS